MRSVLFLALIGLAGLLPSVANAQSSWDVTIVSATGRMQIIQGQTYFVKASFATPRIGAGGGGIGDHRIAVAVINSQSVSIFIVRDRFVAVDHVSSAVLKNTGPPGSFSGTTTTSDGGTVTISVVANP